MIDSICDNFLRDVNMQSAIIPHRRLWAVCLSSFLIYLFHIGPLPGVNEIRYINQTRAIVDDGVMHIDRYHHNTMDKGFINGHYYPTAPPGLSLLAVPPYLAVKALFAVIPVSALSQYDTAQYIRGFLGSTDAPDAFISTYPFVEFLVCHLLFTALLCCLASVGMMIVIDQALRLFTPELAANRRLWLLIIYAFGTLMFFYSTRFFAHASSALTMFGAFLILFRIRRKSLSGRWAFAAGLLNGSALLIDYIAFPAVLVIGIYGLIAVEKRDWVRYISGSSLPVLGLLTYHTVSFGHPFKMPQQLMSGADGAQYSKQFGLGVPDPVIMLKLLFTPYRGFFLYMPVMLCAAYALVRGLLRKDHPHRLEWGVIGGIFLALLLFNGSLQINWVGGYIFGPRYLIPAISFMILLLGDAYNHMPDQLIGAAGVISILINWAGVQYIVSQTAYGALISFLLSGPNTQLYQFLETYFHTMAGWNVPVSPVGGFIILGAIVWAVWRMIGHEAASIAGTRHE